MVPGQVDSAAQQNLPTLPSICRPTPSIASSPVFFRGWETFPKVLKQHSLQICLHKRPTLNHSQNQGDNRDIAVVTPHTLLCRGDRIRLSEIHFWGWGNRAGLPCQAWQPQLNKMGVGVGQFLKDIKYPSASVGLPIPSVIKRPVFIFCIPGFHGKFCFNTVISDLKCSVLFFEAVV